MKTFFVRLRWRVLCWAMRPFLPLNVTRDVGDYGNLVGVGMTFLHVKERRRYRTAMVMSAQRFEELVSKEFRHGKEGFEK